MQDINRSSGGYRSGGKEEGVHSGWKQYKFSLYWLLAPALSLSLSVHLSLLLSYLPPLFRLLLHSAGFLSNPELGSMCASVYVRGCVCMCNYYMAICV